MRCDPALAVLALAGMLFVIGGCSSHTYLETVDASKASPLTGDSVTIRSVAAINHIIPVRVEVPELPIYGQLYREDCYAITVDGRRISAVSPDEAIAAAGVQPLAKAIIKEGEAEGTLRATTQNLQGFSAPGLPEGKWTSGNQTIIDTGPNPAAGGAIAGAIIIGSLLYYNLNPDALRASQIKSWSLPTRTDHGSTCRNRCYVYLPEGTYKTFNIAVKQGWFSAPVLMSTSWPPPTK